MAEYHVGCGAFGIYAGKLNEDKTQWIDKSDVTDEAIVATAQYLFTEKAKFWFVQDGKNYEMKISEVEE